MWPTGVSYFAQTPSDLLGASARAVCQIFVVRPTGSMLLYEFIKALKAGHDPLQSQLALMGAGRSGFEGGDRPIRFISRIAPVDDGNSCGPFAGLRRLQFVQHETFDLTATLRGFFHRTLSK